MAAAWLVDGIYRACGRKDCYHNTFPQILHFRLISNAIPGIVKCNFSLFLLLSMFLSLSIYFFVAVQIWNTENR